MQDWARNNEERRPKLGQKICKIGLLKNGAKLRKKFTFQKDAQLDKSMT